MQAHRIAALFFGAWGVLHIFFGGAMLVAGGTGSAADAARLVATAAPDLVGEPSAAVGGLIMQHAWNLLMFGGIATGLAVLNWKREALIMNAVITSAADIGFVVFVLVPGHIAIADGALGPVLWIGGLVATGFAYTMGGVKGVARVSG